MNPMIQHLYNRVADFLVPTSFTSTWPAPNVPNEMPVPHGPAPSRTPEEPKPPRCPFYVSDPHGVCCYCDQPEELHDERARKGVA